MMDKIVFFSFMLVILSFYILIHSHVFMNVASHFVCGELGFYLTQEKGQKMGKYPLLFTTPIFLILFLINPTIVFPKEEFYILLAFFIYIALSMARYGLLEFKEPDEMITIVLLFIGTILFFLTSNIIIRNILIFIFAVQGITDLLKHGFSFFIGIFLPFLEPLYVIRCLIPILLLLRILPI